MSNSYLNIYKNKKIFITGHTGFKGSWLSYLLYKLGADVCGYSLPANEKSHFNLLNMQDKIKHVEGDVREFDNLAKQIDSFRPEFIFHLAAQALVRPSYDDPRDTFETNLMGSVNLLEVVRKVDFIRSLVFVTSDKCYENVEWVYGYRENDRLGGRDPYSASKATAEIAFSSYLRSFLRQNETLGAASARAGNVIGGGDWAPDRIIPDCVRAIEASSSIKIRNPKATRPWQHVLEPISGYLLLGNKLYQEPQKFSGSWNFGPSSSEVMTVKEVCEYVVNVFQKGKIECQSRDDQQHEAQLLQLNCDKAHHFLNWHPRWSVTETLQATASWYKRFLDGNNPTEITDSQLNHYFGEKL